MCGIPMPPNEIEDTKSFAVLLKKAGGEPLPEELKRLATEVQKVNNFWWRLRGGGGICGACGHRHSGDTFKSDKTWDRVQCPACGYHVAIKDEWRGRKNMIDEWFVGLWYKSPVEPETVCFAGAYMCTDYRRDMPWLEKADIYPTRLCAFSPGESLSYKRYPWYSWGKDADKTGLKGWLRMKRATKGGNIPVGAGSRKINVCIDTDSFERAMSGTKLKRVWDLLETNVGRYTDIDKTPELDAIARWASLEYMHKAGFTQLAREGLDGGFRKSAHIRPRAKRLDKVLGISAWYASQLRLQGDAGKVTQNTLEVYHAFKRAGIEIAPRELMQVAREFSHGWERGAEAIARVAPALKRKAFAYMRKHNTADNSYWKYNDICDYWRQLEALGAGLDDKYALMPKDLDAAHARATAQLAALREEKKLKEAAKTDAACAKRARALKRKYTFEFDGLILAPFESAQEVVLEGMALKHCIGGYVQSYAEGNTILCKLRKTDAPDTPYMSVEFTKYGMRTQCRGLHNKQGTPEEQERIRAFWAAFEARETDKKRESA